MLPVPQWGTGGARGVHHFIDPYLPYKIRLIAAFFKINRPNQLFLCPGAVLLPLFSGAGAQPGISPSGYPVFYAGCNVFVVFSRMISSLHHNRVIWNIVQGFNEHPIRKRKVFFFVILSDQKSVIAYRYPLMPR
jgi:hypothetical protein